MTFSELQLYFAPFYGYLSVTQAYNMKSILTLFFVVVLGAVAIANPGDRHDKVKPIKMDLVLDTYTSSVDHIKTIAIDTDKEVVRLYRRKNTLVKRALNFSTKKTKAKLA